MSFDTICGISFPILNVLVFGVPAWLVFYPPRTVRALSVWFRPILAFLAAQASVYALFYGFVYPASRAYGAAYELAHPNSTLFLDGILLVKPLSLWLPIVATTVGCFVARGVYLAFASLTNHASSPPDDRNA